MNLLDEYVIPIHGLKEGIHCYEFDIESGFFKHFDNPDLPGGKLKVSLSLQKRLQVLEMEFHLIGSLNLVCDLCLEDFNFEVDFTDKLFVRFGDSFEELDNNLIIIPREESRFNVAQYIYEFAVLSIPYKKAHPETSDGTGCNPEMIKKLNELRVTDNKILTAKNIDPRWDKLKNLN